MATFMMSSALEEAEIEQRRKRRRLNDGSASASADHFEQLRGYNVDNVYDDNDDDGYFDDGIRAFANSGGSEVFVESAAAAAERRAAEERNAADDAAAENADKQADEAASKKKASATSRVHQRDAVGFVPLSEIAEQATHLANEAFRADSGFENADMCESSCSEDEEVVDFEREMFAEHSGASLRSSSVPPDTPLSSSLSTSTPRRRVPGSVPRRRRIDQCFLCSHTNRNYDAVYAPDVHRCIEMLEKGIGNTDYTFLSRQVHLYFKHHIYLPMRRAGKRVHMWRSRSILEHIKRHTQEPRVALSRRIDSLSLMLDSMDDMLYYVHPETGKRVPHHANIKAWLDMKKMWLQLYKTDPKTLNFYDPSAGYDPGARVKNVFEGATTAVAVVDRESTQVYRRRKR